MFRISERLDGRRVQSDSSGWRRPPIRSSKWRTLRLACTRRRDSRSQRKYGALSYEEARYPAADIGAPLETRSGIAPEERRAYYVGAVSSGLGGFFHSQLLVLAAIVGIEPLVHIIKFVAHDFA